MALNRSNFYLSHCNLQGVDLLTHDANSSQLISIFKFNYRFLSVESLDMHQVVVVGGGAAGIATAARFRVNNLSK